MGSPCCVCELEEVVGGAEHCPLTSDLFEPAQQELSEPSGVLDVTEDRLNDLLSQPVAAAPPCAFELGGHGCGGRAVTPSFAAAARLAVPRPTCSNEAVDPAAAQMREVGFRAEARIGRDLLRVRAKHAARGGQQRP